MPQAKTSGWVSSYTKTHLEVYSQGPAGAEYRTIRKADCSQELQDMMDSNSLSADTHVSFDIRSTVTASNAELGW